MKVLVAVLCLAALCSADEMVRFDGHKVVEVLVQNPRDTHFLLSLPEVTDGVRGVDVWSHDGVLVEGHMNLMRLTPAGYAAVVARNMTHRVVVSDLQTSMEAKNAVVATAATAPRSSSQYAPADDWWYHWHGFDDIQLKMRETAKKYPRICTFVEGIVLSIEGRKVGGVRIAGPNPRKRAVFISGTHAREWIAEGVSLWAIVSLVEQYETNPAVRQLIDDVEIFIVPVYNPDGYEYSRVKNRYWRKNRHVNKDGSFGVDQNRNWGTNWCKNGASKSGSSDIYCGEAAYSEPEVKEMRDWLSGLGPIDVLIDFHSCATEILRPWAYTQSVCPAEARHQELGDGMVKTIKPVHGTVYESIRGVKLYIHSGTCLDSAYDPAEGVASKLVYVFELDGNDFVVPETDIQRQGTEIFAGLTYLLGEIARS